MKTVEITAEIPNGFDQNVVDYCQIVIFERKRLKLNSEFNLNRGRLLISVYIQ